MLKYLATLYFINSCYCLNFPDYRNHPCNRPCDGKNMICEYNFTFELMFSMERHNCKNCLIFTKDCYNPHCVVCDGKQNMITTINRQIPSPPIEVCRGDHIKVNAKNHLPDLVTSIHWHGQHQTETPFMDGVPMITQCPINPATTFQYHFIATQVGTHFYHAHSGFQRANGIFGYFVVKESDSENKIRHLYDYDLSDHVIIANDWISGNPTEYYYSLERLGQLEEVIVPILVNGFGSTILNGVPPPVFRVKKGYRYRFRLIHAGTLACSITLSVQSHDLTVVSVDGNDIIEKVVDKITISNGERIDFILSANRKHNSYWMSFQGGFACFGVPSLAVLTYENGPAIKLTSLIPSIDVLEFNCLNEKSNARQCVSYMNIKSIKKIEPKLLGKPDFKYFLGYNMESYSTSAFEDSSSLIKRTPAFNNITFVMPSKTLIDSEANEIVFCNAEHLKGCSKIPCECVHMLEIPYNSLVEFIFVSENFPLIIHPIHLHGYAFRVIANEKLDKTTTVDRVRRLDELGLLKRNFDDPPIKDTITPPNGGYSIVRFIAANEGYWFMHCHIEAHMEIGMSLVIKVGNPKKPPPNFPKCGDYFSDLNFN